VCSILEPRATSNRTSSRASPLASGGSVALSALGTENRVAGAMLT
jgi:hypothetical protein